MFNIKYVKWKSISKSLLFVSGWARPGGTLSLQWCSCWGQWTNLWMKICLSWNPRGLCYMCTIAALSDICMGQCILKHEWLGVCLGQGVQSSFPPMCKAWWYIELLVLVLLGSVPSGIYGWKYGCPWTLEGDVRGVQSQHPQTSAHGSRYLNMNGSLCV